MNIVYFRKSAFKLAAVSTLVLSACISDPTTMSSETATAMTETKILPSAKKRMKRLQVKMRDGIRLGTDVYLPDAEGPHPAILIRTPYDTEIDRDDDYLRTFMDAGYAIVEQHERGRYLSEGQMRMLNLADEDGWDTLDWIAAQDWSNGKVATYGCSSSAENQLKLSALGHPAHKAVISYSSGVGIAETGPHKEQGNFWRGGAWQMGWADYFYGAMPLNWPQLPSDLSDAERTALSKSFRFERNNPLTQDDYLASRMHLPMIDLAKALGAPETEIEEYLKRGPSHPAWDDDRITDGDTPKVPGLYAEGLYDISARSGVSRFEQTREASAPGTQSIIITNGQHCGFRRAGKDYAIGDRAIGDMTYDYTARELAFLNRWLKDGAENEPPITAYMAGANLWASFNAVPTAGDGPTHTFYLSSGGSANTLSGDGSLTLAAPVTAASDGFAYDPANPVISHGGEIAGMGPDQEDGSFDQRDIERRDDVLVYTSPPLEGDLAVFGFINTELFVSSDAPDTDFTVKLVDVEPDGTAWNIADTILRMRYRDGMDTTVFMQDGKTYSITPPPMLAANVFKKGHRVRVEVSSSNFPTYARNLNTAGNPYTTTETRIANNSVHHGGQALSRIELPIVELPK